MDVAISGDWKGGKVKTIWKELEEGKGFDQNILYKVLIDNKYTKIEVKQTFWKRKRNNLINVENIFNYF